MTGGGSIVAMALDQSPTATGFAIGAPCDPRPVFGVFNLRSWGVHEGKRLAEFRDWLMARIKRHGVTHLYYEAPANVQFIAGRAKSFDTTSQQNMQIGVINLVAHDCAVPVAQVAASSWRSRFLGTTKAPPGLKGDAARAELKRLALRACALRNLLVEDDNAAEALGILDYGLSCIDRRHAGKTHVLFNRAELDIWKSGQRS